MTVSIATIIFICFSRNFFFYRIFISWTRTTSI